MNADRRILLLGGDGQVAWELRRSLATLGEVVAVGDDEELIKVEPGEVVLYPKYTGTEVTLDGDEHLILEATDLLAIVRTAAVAAAA